MTEEVRRHNRRHRTLSNQERVRSTTEDGTHHDNDLLDRAKDMFPALNIAMNMMRRSRTSQTKAGSESDLRSTKDDKPEPADKTMLRDRLQEKLGELLDEEQALVELYMKAANAAREKEKLYNERIADLMEQTEKDKQLMELFRNI